MLRKQPFARLHSLRLWHKHDASSIVTAPNKSRGRPKKSETNHHDPAGSSGIERVMDIAVDPSINQSRVGSASKTQYCDTLIQERQSTPQRERVASAKLKGLHVAASACESSVPGALRSARLIPRLHIHAAAKHNDLESFLDYALRTELNPSTNVYKGTHYEYTVAKTLEAYGFSLHRTGRANDLGIDLIGHWELPGDDHRYRVLVQCKATQSTPSMIRELEGSFAGAPAGWNNSEVMALLVTAKPMTPGVLQAVQRSGFAMGVLQIRTDGPLQQFVWNQVAEQARLSGLTVANVYRRKDRIGRTGSDVHDNVEASIALHWMGSRWKRASG